VSEVGSIKLTWYGHSSFLVRSPQGSVVLIDPFLTGNPVYEEKRAEIKEADVIALTHGHADHVGDTLEIYQRLRPKVVGMYELVLILQGRGLTPEDSVGMNIGGEAKINNVSIAMVPATHSSTYSVDEMLIPAGLACGYVFTFEDGRRLYHAGDTWLMAEMEFIRRIWSPEIVLLPVGGHFTMDLRAARIALELLSPRIVVPMHYDTFPVIATPEEDIRRALSEGGAKVVIPEPGAETAV